MQQSIVKFYYFVVQILTLTDRPRLRTLPPPHPYGNQRLQRQFDGLLMMGIVMPETRWAVSVRQSNKIFYDWLLHLVGCVSVRQSNKILRLIVASSLYDKEIKFYDWLLHLVGCVSVRQSNKISRLIVASNWVFYLRERMCVLIFSTTYVWQNSHSKTNWVTYDNTGTYISM